MPFHRDRVWETSDTTGTGTYDLSEVAEAGYQTFNNAMGGSPRDCWYCATDGTDWEVGIGTFTSASPDTLARTTILQSSNADAAVDWAAGTRDIFLTEPAEIFERLKAVHFFEAPTTEALAEATGAIAIGDAANAREHRNISIGWSSQAGQTPASSVELSAIAIGTSAKAYQTQGIAIGFDAISGVDSASTSPYAIAIGFNSNAIHTSSIALGSNCDSQGNSSVCIGNTAIAKESFNVALGYGSTAGQASGGSVENYCVAIGNGDALELYGIAIGSGSRAGRSGFSGSPNCIAIGQNAYAGYNTVASPLESSAIAVGTAAKAYETDTIAIGTGAVAGKSSTSLAPQGTAVGASSLADSQWSTAIGYDADARSLQATALGHSSSAREQECIAIGDSISGQTNAGTTNKSCIAIGDLAKAYEVAAVAIGRNSTAGASSGATRPGCVAVGDAATSTAEAAISIGRNSDAVQLAAIAIGDDTNSMGEGTVAIGDTAEARDKFGVAIGRNSRTGQTNNGAGDQEGIAIGYLAKSYEIGTIAIGANAIIGLTSGVTSDYSIALGFGAEIHDKHAIAIGHLSQSIRDHELVHSIDNVATNRHRRGSFGMAIVTADDTPTLLKAGLIGNTFFHVPSTVMTVFHALVIGYCSVSGDAGAYEILGAIKNHTGTPAFVGTPTVTIVGEDTGAWDCTVSVDTTGDGVEITVTGDATNNTEWSCDFRFAEIDS